MSVTLSNMFDNNSEEAHAYYDLVILKGEDFLEKIKNEDFVSKAVAYDVNTLLSIAEKSADRLERFKKGHKEEIVQDCLNRLIAKAKEEGRTLTDEFLEGVRKNVQKRVDKKWQHYMPEK